MLIEPTLVKKKQQQQQEQEQEQDKLSHDIDHASHLLTSRIISAKPLATYT
jgi:hypothetical protein